MAHNAFIAKMHSDELRDTLFFCGCEYTREKSKERGQLTYTYTTPKFTLVVSGRNIRIDNEKFTRVNDAKKRIVSIMI
jgi:hypothetical protein